MIRTKDRPRVDYLATWLRHACWNTPHAVPETFRPLAKDFRLPAPLHVDYTRWLLRWGVTHLGWPKNVLRDRMVTDRLSAVPAVAVGLDWDLFLTGLRLNWTDERLASCLLAGMSTAEALTLPAGPEGDAAVATLARLRAA